MKLCNQPFPDTDELTQLWNKWAHFTLSDFQKWAILGISDGRHVLVGAHTGSGKTLPAEFAIQHFCKKGKKVIYTTPLKAISNQKLYEFSKKYPNISFGLITGDNQFNPNADVLIMTTEILRNTLFREMMLNSTNEGSRDLLSFDIDLQHELGIVIFDEVHYINDHDRGSAVEETMMMLPKHVQMLMLSATLESPEKLCAFIEKNGEKEVWLTMTQRRVVPLTHHAFLTFPPSFLKRFDNATQTYLQKYHEQPVLLKQGKQLFDETSYLQVVKALTHLKKANIRVNQFFVINQVMRYLKDHQLLPAIMFIFSRKRVELFASKIQTCLFPEGSNMPSIIGKKCESILRSKFSNAADYLQRPEYTFIVSLLKKGIAIHHGGILKEFREMTEILFVEGEYIQLLVATETFAVGVNVPAKTVILTSLEKFDGHEFRFLKPHEYTQMAGRAGRRGMDTFGKVFHLVNLFERNRVPTNAYREMLAGKSQCIQSSFKIHFNLILRLLAAEDYTTTSFIENTMLYDSIINKKNIYSKKISEDEQQLSEALSNTCYHHGPDTVSNYHSLLMERHFLKGKKRKKCWRTIVAMEDQHHYLEKDYQKYLKLEKLKEILVQNKQQLLNITNYVSDRVTLHLDILLEQGFIHYREEGQDTTIQKVYTLTEKGTVSTFIQEMHSLAGGELLSRDIFHPLSASELAATLSCFTSVRLSDDMKITDSQYMRVPSKVKKVIRTIQTTYDKYYDIETKYHTAFVEDYTLHYDMGEFIMDWCNATNELECNAVLHNASNYDITLGEFVKAVLKINNIAQELEKVALLLHNVKLLHTLSEIPALTLKGCVTNQSLYL